MAVKFPLRDVQVYSVGEFTQIIKGLLEETLDQLWIEGEVSNLARPASGHLYFTLKDEESCLRAVIYRGVALRLRYDLHDGLRVVARGRLGVYAPRGEYQFLIEEIQPQGMGPLELAYRQLKEKLSILGYFDPGRKRPLPRYPQRVALVTSPTGSAVRDVLEVLARRWPALEVCLIPVRVQGEEASREIASAIEMVNQLNRLQYSVDVLILVRGGGSLEDLWAFNEYALAEAIYHSDIPVVTGVGHEDDLTIADLVADVRALTPSEAAERVVPDRAEVSVQLEQTKSRLNAVLLRQLQLYRACLRQLTDRPCFRRPLDELSDYANQLMELQGRLKRGLEKQLEDARQRLHSLLSGLEALNPLQVLARGYSLTRRLEDLSLLRRSEQVTVGDSIITELIDGRFVSQVVHVLKASDESRWGVRSEQLSREERRRR